MIVNVGHPEGQDDLEKVLSGDDGRGLPATSLRDPIEDTNTLHRGEREPAVGRAACATRSPSLPRRPARHGRAPRPRGSGPPLEGGDVYTDDKAPVEWLIDKSIVDYAAGEDD